MRGRRWLASLSERLTGPLPCVSKPAPYRGVEGTRTISGGGVVAMGMALQSCLSREISNGHQAQSLDIEVHSGKRGDMLSGRGVNAGGLTPSNALQRTKTSREYRGE